MFVLENANIRREGKYILQDLSLHIKKGEHVAIIGPNGSGKSTLLKILTKDIHPLSRDDFYYAFLGDKKIPVWELRNQLGIVTPSLLEACNTTYSAFEIVISGFFSSYGLDFHHIITKEQKELALKEMERSSILYLKDKYMNTLSSGEAVKTLLTRAVIHNPKALILDEVSNSLDFPTRSNLRNLISTYSKEGKTIIMVTHELAEIPTECNRIIIMKNGRIIHDGNKKESLNEKLLSDVYERQIFVEEKNNIYSAWC